LLSPVPDVILSAAKDPEELSAPKQSVPSSHQHPAIPPSTALVFAVSLS